MDHYRKLKKLRHHFTLLPGLKSYKDFDIAIEIGHYEHIGEPLTLKKLLLLNIASEATVRRHLVRLVADGLVSKNVHPNDHRSVNFTLTKNAHQTFRNCINQLTVLLKELT